MQSLMQNWFMGLSLKLLKELEKGIKEGTLENF